jgi:hypothetical protein
MNDLLKPDQYCFNIPLVIFNTGSHFGDNDCLRGNFSPGASNR